MPSRLFQYYNTRYIEGTTDFDSGAEVRDALKALTTVGVCDESLWPYVDSALTLKPSDNCYEAAKLHVATKYYSINNANPQELMSALTQKLFIVFGCAVYAAFEEVGTSGEVPMPDLTCNTPVGGHCMTIVGYEPTITSVTRKYKQWYIVDNSWGKNGAIRVRVFSPTVIFSI
jgi:C1A family cysteine protease